MTEPIMPMTDQEIEKLRKVCGLGIGISGHKGGRLITTIDALKAERNQAWREALEEAAKAMCPFCNGKHEWLAANPINEGYGWRHKYQRIGRESSHFVNCRAWAIRTLELSTIRPMKTIRALAAKEKA